jgi:hypothetical protein
VLNAGRLVLRDRSRIGPANTEVRNTGHLVMDDASAIAGNDSGRSGPALLNSGTLTMNEGSSIHQQGGGGIDNSGTVTMNDRSRSTTTSTPSSGRSGEAGGMQNAGTLRMTGESSIHDNRVMAITGYSGQGGVSSIPARSSWRMRAESTASPSAEATAQGGGLYNASGGVLSGVTCGGNVTGNDPDDCHFE